MGEKFTSPNLFQLCKKYFSITKLFKEKMFQSFNQSNLNDLLASSDLLGK